MSNATHLTAVGTGPDNWQTPPDLFARLNRTFQFDFDAFASAENHLCNEWSAIGGTWALNIWNQPVRTDERDGLAYPWENRRVWMNPPYGRGILADAMKKAASERNNAQLIVAIIPANTDTAWWHDYVAGAASHIEFMRRRVKFIDPATGQEAGSPPGGSALAFYFPDWRAAR